MKSEKNVQTAFVKNEGIDMNTNESIDDGIDILISLNEESKENIPTNDDIDIANVTFKEESATMATSNLTLNMF